MATRWTNKYPMKNRKKKTYSKKSKPASQREKDKDGIEWARRRLFVADLRPKKALEELGAQMQDNLVPTLVQKGKDAVLNEAEKLAIEGMNAVGAKLKTHTQRLINPLSDMAQCTAEDDPAKRWLAESKTPTAERELEQGIVYNKVFEVRANKHSKIFEMTKDMYTKERHTYFDSYNKELSAYNAAGTPQYVNCAAAYSQSGYNRKGWYNPFGAYSITGAAGTINSPLGFGMVNTMCTGSLQRWAFVRQHLCTPTTNGYMQSEADYEDIALRDLQFCLTKSTDTVTIFSRNPDVGIDVTVHILRCKQANSVPPADALSDFNTSENSFLKVPNIYVYDRTSDGAGNRALPSLGRTGLTTFNTFPETCTVPGVTFGMSPTLREHWEVIEVMKPKLMPNDKFNLSIVQNYSDVFSYRNMQSLHPYDTATNTYTSDFYQTGDLALLISFQGDKCNGSYQASEGVPAVNQSFQHAASRISIVSKSSIEYHCMQDWDPDTGSKVTAMQQTTQREAQKASEYFSTKFDDSAWNILVASNLNYKARTTKVDEST